MYRIRLVSGQEQIYRSIQELTAGVQRGEVTGDAEIYHQRSERWLPIESHPHYKMAQEGGTATRTSRLKFTRPSSPAATSGVLPTPAAQKPAEGDLEELNRLLVLLDPLPTPAQRAEPAPPAVTSPPDLTLLRPAPAQPSSSSKDTDQNFGTMLRLEDLEPIPEPEPEPDAVEVIRDERILVEESVEMPAAPPAPEPVAAVLDDVAPSDLGLPLEIHLDEIPVPAEFETLASSTEAVPDPALEPEPAVVVSLASSPSVATPKFASGVDHAEVRVAEAAPAPSHARRRVRPMLFVGAAAILALAVFALTGGSADPDQGMVTLASATAPTAAVAPPPVVGSAPTAPSGAAVGFPIPKAAPQSVPAPAPARDSISSAPLLPSAPSIDVSSGGTVKVDAGGAPRATPGSGSDLARSYTQAYDQLAKEFAGQMDRGGLVRLFSQTQLTTADGLAGARRGLDAATTAVRQYHAREASIEKAYQDSSRALERSGATPGDMRDWITHLSRKESQEAAGEGTRLIGQIDAVFALLQAQSGRYRIDTNGIRFDNADAGARYAELQSWITRRLEHWSGQPASSVPTTVQPLLDGIGLTRLPTPR